MRVEEYFIDLDKLLPDAEKYYAHILLNEENKKSECISEHINRCKKYFVKIFNSKGISEVIEKFEKNIFRSAAENAEYEKTVDIFRKCLFNVITFHDIGKINPLFQEKKMKNNLFMNEGKKEFYDGTLKSNHSRNSAIMYIDYFTRLLRTYELKENEELIRILISMFAFIISRHHSDLTNWQDFVKMFIDKDSQLVAEIDMINRLIENKEYVRNFESNIENEGIEIDYNNVFKIDAINIISKYNMPVYFYALMRMIYSLLVASDYYATTEFMSGYEINDFGNLEIIDEIYEEYKRGNIYKSINEYRKTRKNTENVGRDEINVLRSELFIDAEEELEKNSEKNIFYLEAPTGSGKSNTAMNLSFKLMEKNKKLNKILYIYPFNTLVEQNIETLNKVFGNNEKILSQIAVVNSLFKLKEKSSDDKLYESKKDIVTLLDRQFLNYPMVLSTHVMLFKTMFGDKKEDAFGFHQLCNSVIVLDEIQSYKISIWPEIISFLEPMAKLLNMKVIIMSATLPNLDMLLGNGCNYSTHNLILQREKYFNHTVFKNRVVPDYSLLNVKKEELLDAIIEKILMHKEQKILIELNTKKSAEDFYNVIKKLEELESIRIVLMTGDSSLSDRKKSIEYINKAEKVIVVATQVVEAGVDIDMDIGFKEISKLDSEEQFMGRINRSSKKDNATVYFFDYGGAKNVYKNDIRMDRQLVLRKEKNRNILSNKKFDEYYRGISEYLNKQSKKRNDNNLNDFFEKSVGTLDMKKVSERMELIKDDIEKISLFLPRDIELDNGKIISGKCIWKEYKELLADYNLDYSTKKVRIHNVRVEMNEFIYQINANGKCIAGITYNDRIGNMLYIEDCEGLVEDGVLKKNALCQFDLVL